MNRPISSKGAGIHRVKQLDGFRGIAVLTVVVFHYVAPTINASHLSPIFGKGMNFLACGVDFFFVLSGFLLGGVCLDKRGSSNYFAAFYLRRSYRIFPLYFAWLASSFLLAHWLRESFSPLFNIAGPKWAYLIYVQNYFMGVRREFGGQWLGPTWTLAVEEQFYLLLPALVFFVSRRALPYVLVGLIGSSVPIRMILPHNWYGTLFLPSHWDALFLGVLSAWLVRNHPKIARDRRILWSFAGVTASAAIAFSMGRFGYLGGSLFYTVIGLFAVAIIMLSQCDAWVELILQKPALIWLGNVSYSLYLFHDAIRWLVSLVLRGTAPGLTDSYGVLLTGSALGLSLLLAWASTKYFEGPITRIGRSHGYNDAQPRSHS